MGTPPCFFSLSQRLPLVLEQSLTLPSSSSLLSLPNHINVFLSNSFQPPPNPKSRCFLFLLWCLPLRLTLKNTPSAMRLPRLSTPSLRTLVPTFLLHPSTSNGPSSLTRLTLAMPSVASKSATTFATRPLLVPSLCAKLPSSTPLTTFAFSAPTVPMMRSLSPSAASRARWFLTAPATSTAPVCSRRAPSRASNLSALPTI